MVWDLDCKEVPRVNVTDRYIEVYTKAMESAPLKEGEVIVNILLVKEEQCSLDSDNRFQTEIYVLSGDKVVASGVSPGENDDLNKFLKVKLKKSQEYTFKFKGPNSVEIIRTDSTDSTDGQSITLSLK